jgi:hypothetical protein
MRPLSVMVDEELYNQIEELTYVKVKDDGKVKVSTVSTVARILLELGLEEYKKRMNIKSLTSE